MPRYFFDVHIGQDVIPDPEGQTLGGPDEAWEVARAMAADLMATRFGKPVDWTVAHIGVRDDRDDVLLEFPFLEAIRTDRRSH